MGGNVACSACDEHGEGEWGSSVGGEGGGRGGGVRVHEV